MVYFKKSLKYISMYYHYVVILWAAYSFMILVVLQLFKTAQPVVCDIVLPSDMPSASIQLAAEVTRKYEGLRLNLYRDIGGTSTIGYGHVIKPGKSYNSITSSDAQCLLDHDLLGAYDELTDLVTVPMNIGQEAALIDFVFNEGSGHLSESTLLKVLNQGHYDQVPHELERWVFANHKKLRGLVRRRAEEIDMWRGEY